MRLCEDRVIVKKKIGGITMQLSTLKTYADQMISAASYPESGSPLLADRIDNASKAPWREEDGHIVSNAVHQQNFRVFCAVYRR